MENFIDLHIHSNKSSDGDLSPEEIIVLAKKAGFTAISISDHDSLDAYPEALEKGKKYGIEVIPNIEVTTNFNGRELHILFPFIKWKSKEIESFIKKIKKRRFRLALKRIEKLKEIGFNISMDEVLESSQGTPPLGTAIAKVILEKERTNPRLEKYFEKDTFKAPYRFYKDYFEENKPAYVHFENIPAEEAIKIGKSFGGVPVLAHPGASFCRIETGDAIILKKAGLKGLEVWTSYHNEELTEKYLKMALDNGLIPSAGSDFHGKIKPIVTIGMVKGDYRILEDLKKRR
ncbi:MAG: PHP domain-containing protein [Acidobacteriota bacterium]